MYRRELRKERKGEISSLPRVLSAVVAESTAADGGNIKTIARN